ncbi:3-oxoacyl-ACP reductase [Arthrobacter sp. StoSoilA2]|uniref:SDR family NAD(P)-dependent oxidoreductase n=1 Tax=unclassified Arthrobacter TaxID=235627 RepID=UPI001CC474E4|nr:MULTISPECIES: glucose 1-dehydrogenase [unclassified Arthrobacter]MDR6685339.1 gluconate 5-dehydrogenase/2-deoxy-D-gluconate 3-dehydrogenase [Arthrobacter sp. 1088]BCW36132.1 3-oxoacyl-ACP reductase [Arthrobacter sp. StoSoilA2]BCW48214.1 3-oxoacyl-ACP reductase [Arthrobacter sp. StoSoilB13]
MNETTDRFRLDGDVVVVTGGGSGIGKTLAAAYADVGATVIITDANEEAAELAAAEVGHGATAVAIDVTNEASVTDGFARIADEHGKLDVLFNNAGVNRRVKTTELSMADWQLVIAVNMTGSMLAARAAAAIMFTGGGGRIVNTASALGLSGGWYPNLAYQATKGAVVNMTRSLAVEWGPQNIRVNAVAPSLVRTPFIKAITDQPDQVKFFEGLSPLGRIGDVEDLIGPVIFLSSRSSDFVTGHILLVDGGLMAS